MDADGRRWTLNSRETRHIGPSSPSASICVHPRNLRSLLARPRSFAGRTLTALPGRPSVAGNGRGTMDRNIPRRDFLKAAPAAAGALALVAQNAPPSATPPQKPTYPQIGAERYTPAAD